MSVEKPIWEHTKINNNNNKDFGIENLHRAHKYRFISYRLQIFWEISRDTTFTTVNLPIGTVS